MIDFQIEGENVRIQGGVQKMGKARKASCTDNWHSFTALRGVQAGREYYVAMCPIKVIPKIFLFDEVELAPELRAQRTLNRARIPEIARYLTENPTSYSFSSITASIDADTAFEPFNEAGPASNAGRLLIPMTARFLINDGQHRRAAIEEALKECPELGDEMLSVVFFVDAGLKRSQQMFADLNRHAIRPTKSLGILYDRRDPLSQLACRLVENVSVFKNMTEMEKTSIPNRSNRLHTLSSIYQATRTLLGKPNRCKTTETDEQLAAEFWETVSLLRFSCVLLVGGTCCLPSPPAPLPQGEGSCSLAIRFCDAPRRRFANRDSFVNCPGEGMRAPRNPHSPNRTIIISSPRFNIPTRRHDDF